MRRRPRRGDRGAVSLELVSFTFVVVLAAVLCVQGIFVTQATSVAQQAARDGARAPSLGRVVEDEVRRAVPGWATVDRIRTTGTPSSVRVEVGLRVPIVIPGVTSSRFVVTRDAVMPRG